MWVNPKYARPEEPRPAPPEPSGRVLATFERPGRGRGPDAELRVTLENWQGNDYFGVRVWSRGADGPWYPTRRGCSIRLSEAEDLADVLGQAVAQLRADEAKASRRSAAGPARHHQRP